MSYFRTPFNYEGTSPTQVRDDLNKANMNFTTLSNTFVSNDPTTGVVKDSDKVDNYHASQTPTPNTIPVAKSDGKIDVNWLPPSVASLPYETYSKMYVGDEIPTNLQHGDLVYVRTQDRLYRYDKRTGQLVEVDWKTIIESSPEWKSGRLRVNSTTGKLEISSDGSNWYACIPAVGSQAIELASIDNTSYSLLYWIAPGQTVVIRNANHVPVVYAKDVVPFFSGSYFHSFAYDFWIGLRPSNVAISDGDGQFVGGYDTIVDTGRSTSLSIAPILEQSSTLPNWANFELRILSNSRFLVNAVGQAHVGYAVIVCNSSATASVTSYWLGTWFNQDGQQFTMNNLTLTRRS